MTTATRKYTGDEKSMVSFCTKHYHIAMAETPGPQSTTTARSVSVDDVDIAHHKKKGSVVQS